MCDYRTMTMRAEEWADIGQRVREARLAAQMSQDELGRQIGLDRTMIAKIEAGNRRIDAVELVRLSSCLALPLDHFLSSRPAVLSRRTALLEDEATDAGRESFQLEASLVSWLRDVRQLEALGVLQLTPVLRYPGNVDSEEAAREAASWLRTELDCSDRPISSLMTACERIGLYVSIVDLPGDGASVMDGDIAAAVVSSKGDPGRRRATAAHELGHIVLGDEYSSDLGVHASRATREAVVDAFAAEFLLPTNVIERNGFSRDVLVRHAATYRTSWTLAVRQSVRADALDSGDLIRWLSQKPTKAELMDAIGWAPQPDLESVRVPPSIAHAVIEATRLHLITVSRAVELMRGQLAETDLATPGEEDLEP